MFLLLPFLVGAGSTGLLWYQSSKEVELSPEQKILQLLKPILLIVIVVLLLRWLYKKGTIEKS